MATAVKTVKVNGGDAVLGLTQVLALGFTTSGKTKIVKAILLDNGNGGVCCRMGGINITVRNLADFYLNTPENNKALKAQIAK